MGMITNSLNQTAVYWGTPVKDTYGKISSFATAVEKSVRWQIKHELFLNNQGKQELSKAVIWIDFVAVLDGYLYLGSLSDLSTEEKADPQLIENAHPIKAFANIPDISGNDSNKKVWL
jgi:hypothetical protein